MLKKCIKNKPHHQPQTDSNIGKTPSSAGSSNARSIGRRGPRIFGVLFLSLILVGVVYQQATQILDRRYYSPPGQMLMVEGVATHIYCSGNGSPTVILEAGATGFAQAWAWVQESLAEETRVCSYDRPGLGWSEHPAEGYSGIDTARHLRSLLEQAQEAGPFVMVGHSMGGPLVQIFTGLYPEEVAAVGLVDPTHPALLERYPVRAGAQKEAFSTLIRVSSLLSYTGLLRASNLLAHKARGLPPEDYRVARLFAASPHHLNTTRRELDQWDVTMTAAIQHMDLRGRPLTVLSATEVSGVMPEEYLEPIQALHGELARTSTDSHHIKIPEADHFSIILDAGPAQQTAAALKELVKRTRQKDFLANGTQP